ncbi:MAG: BlaI/MecI/CopY family transcriptional regulator, partial [Bacteroidota bacterium]
MKQLTKAQEDLMHYVWQLGDCSVGDLRTAIAVAEGAQPAHSTVSTLVLALRDRGFIEGRKEGRSVIYTPTISREAYGQQSLGQLIRSFFGGSPELAVSHLVREENLSLEELNKLVRQLEEE